MSIKTFIPSGFPGEREIIIPADLLDSIINDPVTEQLYVTHIGYYPNAKCHYRERPNGAEQYIFIYCESGTGWVEYNGERMTLAKDQFVILPPYEKHAYGSGDKKSWSIYWLHFKGTNAPFFNSIMGRSIEIKDADNSRIQDRLILFAEIYRNIEHDIYDLENLQYTSFCLMHFLASLKYIKSFREIKTIGKIDNIQKCIQFMKDHLEGKITLSDIADFSGYSITRINTLFRTETGVTPMEYFSNLKIQRACKYLRDSDLKIKEIAFKLNYSDQFHFSKNFYKKMGTSPLQYRKTVQTKGTI